LNSNHWCCCGVGGGGRSGLANIIASLAVGGRPEELDALPVHVREAVSRIAAMLEYRDGRCPLCDRTGFTPRGYYLHLSRHHDEHLEELARSLAERLAGEWRNV